jgi:thymidylate synthase
MGKLITADTCCTGWIYAVQHLLACGGDCFNLVIEIEKPTVEHVEVRRLLDTFLEQSQKKPVDEVANTIFPKSLYFPSLGRKHLYSSYEMAWPLIRLFNNRWGTYFYRMIHWETNKDPLNQLEDTISKLHRTLSQKPKYRSIYEVSIYCPNSDSHIPRGGPCLSHLSFKLEDDRLHLTVVYRNHFYIERAYGNFIGLGCLMEFIAKESGISVGRLTCISTHAELDIGKQAATKLLKECIDIIPEIEDGKAIHPK